MSDLTSSQGLPIAIAPTHLRWRAQSPSATFLRKNGCMGKHYTHLSCEERAMIQAKLELGFKPRAIARGLNRAASTIKRELDRNGWQAPTRPRRLGRPPFTAGYRLQNAQARANALASKPRVLRKLVVGSPLWRLVLQKLACGLSPEQVGGTLS